MNKIPNTKKNIYIFSSFNPHLNDNITRTNISITAFNFFKQIYDGFNENFNPICVNNFEIVGNSINYLSTFKTLKSIFKLHLKKGDYVILDSTILTFLIYLVLIQFLKGIKLISIVTDLPLVKKTNIFFFLINYLFLTFTLRKVFISHKMFKKFPLFKSICIPTYFPTTCQIDLIRYSAPSFKYFYYAGSFDEINNIEYLIFVTQSFLSNNLKLILAGSGGNYELLKSQTQNPFIIFLGKVHPDYSRFLMRKAFVLLNFRLDDKKVTEYSFPFKMMEYIGSLTPIFSSYISSFNYLEEIKKNLTTFSYNESFEVIKNKLENMIININEYNINSLKLYEALFIKYNISRIIDEILFL
jgi:hypothetical protein